MLLSWLSPHGSKISLTFPFPSPNTSPDHEILRKKWQRQFTQLVSVPQVRLLRRKENFWRFTEHVWSRGTCDNKLAQWHFLDSPWKLDFPSSGSCRDSAGAGLEVSTRCHKSLWFLKKESQEQFLDLPLEPPHCLAPQTLFFSQKNHWNKLAIQHQIYI